MYKFWLNKYLHAYPEIKLNDTWIEFDVSYDINLHEALRNNKLNFGKDPEKRELKIDFSKKGVTSAQDLYSISDEGHGNDLSILTDYLREMPLLKRILFPFLYNILYFFNQRMV